MEIEDARALLGVNAADDWLVVRAIYRQRIRKVHPDVAGDGGRADAAALNDAYRTLALAHREGQLHRRGESPPDPTPTGPRRVPRDEHRFGRPDDVSLDGTDTLVFESTPAETFRRMVEAAHQLGDISYLDRRSAIFEAVLHLDDGTHASFVVSLQWRAHNATTEAFCTLEALERAEQLDVSGVLEQLVELLPPDAEA